MSARAQVASGSVGGPQVVVGITAPRSEDSNLESRGESRSESALESREARGPEAQLTIPPSPAVPKLEVLAEPTLELVREAERLELVREKSLEIVRESLELVRESLEGEPEGEPGAEAVQHGAVEAEGTQSESLATEGTQTGSFETEGTQPAASDTIAEASLAFTVIERDSQHAQLTPPPHRSALLTPDEMSIPPMGDLSVEPVADRFFSEGELATVHGESDEEEWDEVANKAKRKSLPEVVQRRARFAKYVRWAVGGAAVVCLAALARTTMVPAHSQSASAPAALAAVEAPAVKAATSAVIVPAAAPVAVAEPAKAVETVAPVAPAAARASSEAAKPEAVPAEAAEARKAEAPKAEAAAEPAKPAAPVATGDKTALQEKNDARRSLERGKLADAIEAGERSVALDPTDGEAWLLLGAAYQEKGKNADARRCYSSCVKEGKRGPIGECRAMVR